MFTPERFGRTPVVYLDRTPIDDRRALLEVRQDYAAAGEVAARELLSAEPISYAYAGYRIRTAWSDKRGDAFVATIRLHGKPCARLDAPPHGRMDPVRARAWFTALPKPCAIFCANDTISESVLGICETIGRTIRDEIAETRFQRVCTLLRNPKRRIGPLAQFCGYGTETALRIAFKKRAGLSMRAYRDRA